MTPTLASPESAGPPLTRDPEFLKLWAGQAVSLFGSLISRTALPLTAVLLLNASPAQVAALAACDMAPGLAVGLFAGALADRVRRRPLLIAADLARAALLCVVPLAAWAGTLRVEHLYAASVLLGAFSTLFDVAYGAYLPTLVGPARVADGNAKLAATASAAEVGAFGVAGWLVQWFGGPIAVLIDAASFLVSAASLALIRRPEPPPGASATPADPNAPPADPNAPPVDPNAPPAGRAAAGAPPDDGDGELPPGANLRAEIVEGLRLVASDPLLRPLALCEAMLMGSFRTLGTIYVLFVTRELHISPGVQGTVYAIGGLTSFGGALFTGWVTRRLGVGKTMTLGIVASGLGVLTLPFAPSGSWVAVALLAANQFITDPGYTLYEINQRSLRQAATPNRLRGRVEATFRFLAVAAQLLGIGAAGLLGETLGPRAALLVGAFGACLAAIPLLASPAVRQASAGEPAPGRP